MITKEILLNNDYKQYQPDMFHSTANAMYQKKLKNNSGRIMFFITIYEYGLGENIYNVELQFEKEKYTMNIDLFGINEDLTLEQLENEVYKIWFKLKCEYYE